MIFNNKLGFISGTPNGLSITGTGLALALASTSTTGALSLIDWNTFNNKLGSLNGQTGTTQTFAVGTSGTDFNITSTGNVHTFNLPDASGTAHGLVSTGTQTFTGAKTFNAPLTINSQQTGTGGIRFTQLNSASTTTAGNGKVLSVDATGNIILANEASVAGADVIAQKSTALTLAVAPTVVPFNSIISNINNAYSGTTGVYTVPAGDTYEISASMTFNFPGNPGTTTSSACVGILRAGVLIVESCDGNSNDVSAVAFSGTVNVTAPISMTLGQTGAIIAYIKNVTAAAAPTFVAIASSNYLSITRVGQAALITSDERLKKDIVTFTGGLSDILSLRTVSYEYNGKTKNAINDGRKHVGIIAQEVQSGSLGKWAITTGPDGYLRYDPNAVIYSLVNSVKELDKKSLTSDTDDTEYANTLGASGSLTLASSSLDRFSWMVKRSLSKIDPGNTISTSGSTSSGVSQGTFASAVTTLANGVSSLSGSLDMTNTTVSRISSDVSTLRSDVDTLSGKIAQVVPLSEEDRSVLDSLKSTVDALIVSISTTFSEVVTFVKGAIFYGSVEFHGRVTFYDADMAGTATIPAGAQSVYVAFHDPYTVIPKITASADDFVTFRITDKTTAGFTIEIQTPATSSVSFDWIALHVK